MSASYVHAMEDQQAMESAMIVSDDMKEHFEASSSTSLYWTSIDNVPHSGENIVRILPGKKVSKFVSDHIQLHEKIGEGGQGKIYKAGFLAEEPYNTEYTEIVRRWVVKKFKGKALESRYGQWPEELFTCNIDCHFVCKFYGYFIHEDFFCLAMEKYDCSLRDSIDKHMKKGTYKGRPFHGPTAMMIIIELAVGMAYLHLLNIVHRDLKAENIFIMNCGEDDDTPACAFIGDFDIAPTVIGTGFWRAPEILQSYKDMVRLYNTGCIDDATYEDLRRTLPFTTKSDVYSFAMTCYEILTGRIPFEGIRLRDYDVVLFGERPKLPSNLNPKMKELLNKCWQHDPDARPSFIDIVSELKGFVEGTKLYDPIFDTCNDESLRLRNSSLESNFLELKELVCTISNKYNQEDFAIWAIEFGDALEQFKVQFGLQSFLEQPILPACEGLSRMVLLNTIHSTWQMFCATCPLFLPECIPFRRLTDMIVINKMQEGFGESNIDLPDNATPEEVANYMAIWNAWEEEKQSRPSIPANRHNVCCEVLTSKCNFRRNEDQACDLCKHLPYSAPKSTICTFSLYSKDKFAPLKSAFPWSGYIMKKLLSYWWIESLAKDIRW